jgi:hypothetical protein
MNKFFLPILILAALSLSAADSPNVLLILSDDHSMPHVGVYGSANCTQFNITPNLDTFATCGDLRGALPRGLGRRDLASEETRLREQLDR